MSCQRLGDEVLGLELFDKGAQGGMGIIAQAPRLAAHIPLMRERITQALELQPGQLNIKAKTAERLGPVGQGAAIEARAVALLVART